MKEEKGIRKELNILNYSLIYPPSQTCYHMMFPLLFIFYNYSFFTHLFFIVFLYLIFNTFKLFFSISVFQQNVCFSLSVSAKNWLLCFIKNSLQTNISHFYPNYLSWKSASRFQEKSTSQIIAILRKREILRLVLFMLLKQFFADLISWPMMRIFNCRSLPMWYSSVP